MPYEGYICLCVCLYLIFVFACLLPSLREDAMCLVNQTVKTLCLVLYCILAILPGFFGYVSNCFIFNKELDPCGIFIRVHCLLLNCI